MNFINGERQEQRGQVAEIFLKEKRRKAVKRASNQLKIGLHASANLYEHMVKYNKTNFHIPGSGYK